MFKPGNPGKQKGSVGKATKIVNEFREKYGDQWVMEVWSIATNPNEKTTDRLQALNIIGKKVFPDQKAVEISGELDTQPEREIDLTKLESTELDVLKKVLESKQRGEE